MILHNLIKKIKNRIGFFKESDEVEIIEFNESGEVEHFPLFQKLFLSLTIILVALLSFGIGRLSMMGNREPIQIEYDPTLVEQPIPGVSQSASAINATGKLATPNNNDIGVVASKNGTRYHYSYCAGAKQIKEENKIVFATPAAAEASGFTLAANCKPR